MVRSLKFLLPVITLYAPAALAQNLTSLIFNHRNLTTLSTLLTTIFPAGLLENNGTFFAPSDQAFAAFLADQDSITELTEERLQGLISYHLLPTIQKAADLRASGGTILETRLAGDAFANLQGQGNVLFASAQGRTGLDTEQGDLRLYSGVGPSANITIADLEFDGGVVHIIDQILSLPQTCTQTAEEASLSRLLEAFRAANLWDTVDSTAKFTCFAPTDEAFQASGIDITALSTQELSAILRYHSIVGEVGYSTALEDGQSYQTMLGVPVTVHKRDGQLLVNDVAVREANIVMTNGVAHVLSGVLIPPENATTGSDPNASGSSGGGTLDNGSTSPLMSQSLTLIYILLGVSAGLLLGL